MIIIIMQLIKMITITTKIIIILITMVAMVITMVIVISERPITPYEGKGHSSSNQISVFIPWFLTL